MRLLPVLLIFSALSAGDVRHCVCDLASPESMAQHECALCREAEKQPADEPVFFLKDNNPRKLNRWLALPRAHAHSLTALTPAQRTALWTAAIAKARELWGDDWGLAVNADSRRSQCHLHVHIGRLADATEPPDVVVSAGPADIPLPPAGSGIWIHPVAGKLHVHSGEDAPETRLMR